jgi:UDP-N-acetylglucosamine--dolichyl-phosphate N-acetylglucosaminephosphotransferase
VVISKLQQIILFINFLAPLTFIIILSPFIIRKLNEKKIVVKDYHKKDLTMVPTYGGLLIIIASFSFFALNSLFFEFSTQNYIILLVIISFGLFGLIDDMINVGQLAKLCIMYYCSYPLIQYTTHTTIIVQGIQPIEFGILYSQLIIPTFVLVSSNLINMHAGFNGLDSGLSILILISLILKSVIIGDVENIISIVSLTGALVGYYIYERYPSRIFWGNVGSLAIGAAIGIIIVIQGFLISGFIMLFPHTINFLMYVYWKWKKFPDIEFARVRRDGTLEVPNRLTLKWVLPYYFNMTEKQATYSMYFLTGTCCIISIFIQG